MVGLVAGRTRFRHSGGIRAGANEVALVAFTSAAQAVNLFAVARNAGCEQALVANLARCRVASIGPACSSMLRKLGVRVDIEAHPPKLGPFMDAIDQALGASGRS